MEVETEPNVYEQYEEYVTQVEVKQSDYISAKVEDEKNVDVNLRLFLMVVKPFVCGNDETAKDDKTGGSEVEECAKSNFGYQGNLVSLRQGNQQRNEETLPRQVICQGYYLSLWKLH